MSSMQPKFASLAVLLLGSSVDAQDRTPRRPLPRVIATELDPRRDGLPSGNDGDFASPDGNCWGMSLMAIDDDPRLRR